MAAGSVLGRAASHHAFQMEMPDLIITDYQMPHLSGLELCQRLKQIPATSRIPAVMLTARGFTLDNRAMTATGIVTFLNKPFSPREILNVVDDVTGVSTS